MGGGGGGGGLGRGGGELGGGQGGCEWRIEVFGKIHTKNFGGGGGGGGGVGGGSERGVRLGGAGLVGGVRVDVNEELKFL